MAEHVALEARQCVLRRRSANGGADHVDGRVVLHGVDHFLQACPVNGVVIPIAVKERVGNAISQNHDIDRPVSKKAVFIQRKLFLDGHFP